MVVAFQDITDINKIKAIFRNELIQFYLFILLNVFMVYYAPIFINQIFYLFSLVLFWNSRKNYFWFAFLLFIAFAPGGVFHATEMSAGKVLGSYNITSGASLNYFDLFVPLAFFKALTKKRKLPFYFSREFNALYLLAILTLIGSLVIGIEIKTFIAIMRYWLPFTFLYSIPRLFKSKEEFYLMIYLVLPSAFLILFFQTLLVFFNYNVLAFLTGNIEFNDIYRGISGAGTSIRTTNFSVENILLNIIFALAMLLTKNKIFSNNFLKSIIIVSALSIILSATRQWMFMLFFGIIYYMFFIIKKKMNFFIQGALVLILFFGLVLIYPPFSQVVDESFERFMSLDKIASKGAQTEGSANMRFNIRIPFVIEKIIKSPYIGWGFTREFTLLPQESQGKQAISPTGDYHTGNLNLVANVGIIGFLFFLVFWIRVIKIFLNKMNMALSLHKKAINSILMFFIIFLIVHFVSYQFFGLTQPEISNYFMVVYYFLASIIFLESEEDRKLLIKNLKPST